MRTTNESSSGNSRRLQAFVDAVAGVGAVLVITLVSVGQVNAAPSSSLEAINQLAGQRVRVRDRSGHETSGRILSASATALVLQLPASRQTIPVNDIERVTRDGDAIWDGAAVGALVGVLLQAFPIEEGPRCSGTCFSDTRVGKGLGVLLSTGIGAWIDSRHSHHELVYQAP
jgi:hypothetical protein